MNTPAPAAHKPDPACHPQACGIKSLLPSGIAVLSLLGFVILLAALAGDGLRTRPEALFAIPSDGRDQVILDFKLLESQGGINRHSLRMECDAAEALLNSPTVSLLMVCNWMTADIVSAEMLFQEKSTGKVTARYTVKAGSRIRENRQLTFVREGATGAAAPSGAQTVSVEISSGGTPNLAVIGQFSEGEPLSKMLWIPNFTHGGRTGFASACGRYETGQMGETYSKAELLAHTWGFGAGKGRVIYSVILASALVWALGLFALARGSNNLTEGLSVAAGATLLFFSIGLVYSILVPPFQSPDEPDHFLSFSEIIRRPDLSSDALQLSKLSHFERIKFRTDEKFAGVDVGRPLVGGWASHIEASNSNRSPVAATLWWVLGPLFGTGHAGTAVLSLRGLNILFVSLCLGLSIALAAWALRPDKITIFSAAPALLTPSIAFFSMGVSNYPFLVGGYLLQANALVLMWAQTADGGNNPRIPAAIGALCGTGIALAISAADNGLFALAFWGLVLPLYWCLRGLHAGEISRELSRLRLFSCTFFGTMVAGWMITGLGSAGFGIIPLMLPGFVKAFLSGAGLQYLGVKTLLGLVFVASVVLGSLIALYAGWKARLWNWLPFAKRAPVFILLLALCYIALAGIPQIPEDHSTSAYDFTRKVVLAFFQWFVPGRNDLLVAQSFWGNFGWLDSPLPEFLTNTLKTGALAGLASLVYFSLKSTRYFAGTGFLLVNIVAIAVFVSCVSAGYYSALNIVNGRYFIGPYLMILVLAYEGCRRLLFAGAARGGILVNPGVCLICVAVHSTAWMTILGRYF